MRKVKLAGERKESIAGLRLENLAYADDICLLADDLEDLRRMTERNICEAGKVWLRLNTKNIEIIMTKRINDTSQIMIENKPLKKVENLVYLGCEIRKDGDIRNEVGIRNGKAGAAFKNMEKIWNEDGMSLRTKLKLVNGIILLDLLFVCESWKGPREIADRVKIFESGCLRKILKIRWYDMVR